MTLPLSGFLSGGRIHLNPGLTERHYVDVRAQGSGLAFRATRYVGLIPLNSRHALNIVTKVPTQNLLSILAVAEEAPHVIAGLLRLYEADKGQAVFDLLVDALRQELRVLDVRGVHRQYVERAAGLSTVRGRVRIAATIERHWSRYRFDHAECSYFEMSKDIPLNRAIYFTLWWLARVYPRLARRVDNEVVGELRERLDLFRGVTLDLDRRFLSALRDAVRGYRIGEAERHLRQLLGLCLVLISDLGVRLDVGVRADVSLPPLVFNMEDAFQKFLVHGLQACANEHADFSVWDTNREHRKPLYGPGDAMPVGVRNDFDPERLANPDFVFAFNGTAKLVCDAKYALSNDRGHVYQVVAHALAYGASDAALVYPTELPGQEAACSFLGTVGAVRVFALRIPLDTPDVTSELVTLRDNLMALCGDARLAS